MKFTLRSKLLAWLLQRSGNRLYGRDGAPDGLRGQRRGPSPLRSFIALPFVFMGIAAGAGPSHTIESVILLFCLTLPLSLLAAIGAVPFLLSGRLLRSARARKIKIFVLVFFAASMVCVGTELLINRFMDHAPAKEIDLPISRLYMTHGRHSGYYLAIASPGPSPLPFTVSEEESFSITAADYAKLHAGEPVKFLLHPGLLHLPWMEILRAR